MKKTRILKLLREMTPIDLVRILSKTLQQELAPDGWTVLHVVELNGQEVTIHPNHLDEFKNLVAQVLRDKKLDDLIGQ